MGAEYVTHTTVGHKDHDVTFKKLPMYSFPKGEKRTMKGIVDKGPFIKDVTCQYCDLDVNFHLTPFVSNRKWFIELLFLRLLKISVLAQLPIRKKMRSNRENVVNRCILKINLLNTLWGLVDGLVDLITIFFTKVNLTPPSISVSKIDTSIPVQPLIPYSMQIKGTIITTNYRSMDWAFPRKQINIRSVWRGKFS